jgi:hypothetical protein
MSQIIKAVSAGTLPPTVPTSFVTDDGTAVPAANVLNVLGLASPVDGAGLQTQASPDLSDNLEIVLTNYLTGTGTSTNASVVNLIALSGGASPASFRFRFDVTGRDTTTGDTIGYTLFASAKTDGANTTSVATPFVDVDEDASLVGATIDMVTSGNSMILQVTGVAGQTIAYKAVGTYVVV